MYFVRKGVRGKPLLWYIRGMPSKLFFPVIKISKHMNIIKRFAYWVLREDLLNLDISIQSTERSLKEKQKEINDVQSKLNDWILRSKVNKSSILPQFAVKSIIDCLPNPNDAAAGSYTLKKGKSVYFSHYVRGQKMNHLVRIEAFCELNKVIFQTSRLFLTMYSI